MPTLNVDKSQWNKAEYAIGKKYMGGYTFSLEARIKDYMPKDNGNMVVNTMRDFLICQRVFYESAAQEDPHPCAFAISSYAAAQVALGKCAASPKDFFGNTRINPDKDIIDVVNDTVEVYLSSLRSNPGEKLENITSSFLSWNQRGSRDILRNFPEQKKKYEQLPFSVLEKRYVFSLEEKESPEKYSVDFSQFDAKTPITVHVKENTLGQKKKAAESIKPLFHYIAGHQHIKEEFLRLAERIKHKEYFVSLLPPKMVFDHYLLYGPPGTGKTTLVSNMAQEMGLLFQKVNCAELGSSFYNQTATNLNGLFKYARSRMADEKTPGIILFFDEFDHIGRRRGSTNSSEDDKLITTLNTWLDGNNYFPGLVVIGATNRQDQIDAALRSRFKMMEVGYPKSRDEYLAVHQAVIQKIQDYAQREIFEHLDFDNIYVWNGNDDFKSPRVIERVLYSCVKEMAHRNIGKSAFRICTSDVIKAYEQYMAQPKDGTPRPNGVEVVVR